MNSCFCFAEKLSATKQKTVKEILAELVYLDESDLFFRLLCENCFQSSDSQSPVAPREKYESVDE